MKMRPRCRLWLPLATQQLRLRNLAKIHGLNIESGLTASGEGEVFIYYTLHHTKDGLAFYTSEPLPQRHMQQKWEEIVCDDMAKSNANCVCVKVWARSVEGNDRTTETAIKSPQVKEPISALSKELSNNCLYRNVQPKPPDKLLFMWGVYFSGLIPLNQHEDAKCNANCLIFQLNGEYFTSPEYFTVESLRGQLLLNMQRYSASVPKPCAPATDNFAINSPAGSRSSSPVPTDWQRDLLGISKTRYFQLLCARCEVRKSYDLKKLLEIQDLQRRHLQKMRDSQEIVDDIKQRSIRCITKEQLLRKPRTSSLSAMSAFAHHQHHSMGRTLSVLLAEQQQISPQALLQAQRLEQELETLRSRQRLLEVERKTYTARIEKRREQLTLVQQSCQQLHSWLHTRQEQLQSEMEELDEKSAQQMALQQRKRYIEQSMERRMSALCMELREIYPISTNQNGFYTVCGVPFPNIEAYMNDAKYASSINSTENVLPMALSASLGYIAHLVQMIAVIINRPLRNPIIHEGSRSRIMDIVKDIPYGSIEFPLYSRSAIPSKLVKYAIYLLNQNITQLCYDITGVRGDLRATIENTLRIFNTLAEIEQNQREIHKTPSTQTHPSKRLTLQSGNNKIMTCGNDSVDCLSKSHSSIDMCAHVPVPLPLNNADHNALQMPKSQPLPIVIDGNATQQRVSRSVGSYSDGDDDFKDIGDHCYSNSDSNIPIQRRHV